MEEPPDFDEDDLLDDYINDEEEAFGYNHQHHHSCGGGMAMDEEQQALMEEAMLLEDNDDNNDKEDHGTRTPTTTTTTGKEASDSGQGATSTERGVESTDTTHAVHASNIGGETVHAGAHSRGNTNSVDDYLASRTPEYEFLRYTKKTEWRSSNNSNSSKGTASKKDGASKVHGRSAKARTHTAPDAHFLDLLQMRGSSNSNSRHTQKVLLKRSFNGVLNSPKAGVPTIAMTLGDGTRVHIRSREGNGQVDSNKGTTSQQQSSSSSSRSSSSTFSLGVSMRELKRRVESTQRRNIFNQIQFGGGSGSGDRTASNKDGKENASSTKNKKDDLWVDRHAPSAFAHLLSDERTNREVLRALREWDPYVFRREVPSRPTSHVLFQQQQDEGGRARGRTEEKLTTNPADKRPEESRRVILLSGPPGVGKSTLAHIVARHAGYRPIEVNASDDRSSTVLADRVQRAMESTTINFQLADLEGKLSSRSPNQRKTLGMKRQGILSSASCEAGRPNCLILDEIDGADAKGAIQSLVDMIRAEIPPKSAKRKATYLRRPIICICNHKFAPALRPLLPYAAHFNVDPPSSARLVARLKDILNKEGLNMMAGGSLLHQLVVSTGGDIRSSLFTLQFASTRAEDSKDLSQALTNSLNGTGLKDSRSDLASTVSTIFRRVKDNGLPGKSSFSVALGGDKASTKRVIDSVVGFGDDSTVLNSLFVNILRVSYIDPTFDRCSAAHELLSAVDASHGGMMDYQLAPVAAGIHLLCRVEMKPNLNFSTRELSDSHYQQESNVELVRKFADGLPAKARHLKCQSLLSVEFIPLALWVLSAGDGATSLRRAASSIDILSNMERERVDAHVEALCALGLTYVPDHDQRLTSEKDKPLYIRGDASEVEMRLEPPIHRLVEYRSIPSSGLRRKDIPSVMKELLAHQVKLESLRRLQRSINQTEAAVWAVDDNVAPNIDGLKDAGWSNAQNQEGEPSKTVLASPGPKITQSYKTKAAAATCTPAKDGMTPEAKIVNATPSPTALNFLGIGAKKAKAMKSARRAAAVGLTERTSKKFKLAHSGSGFALNQVVKMRYVKGFTQAVRTPCRLQDLE